MHGLLNLRAFGYTASFLLTRLWAHEYCYSLWQASVSGSLYGLILQAWESLHPEFYTGAIPPSGVTQASFYQ